MNLPKNSLKTTTKHNLSSIEKLLLSSVRTPRSLQMVLQNAMCNMTREKMRVFSSFSNDLSKAQVAYNNESNGVASPFGISDSDVKSTTLPAVVSYEVVGAGESSIQWTDLSMLPGAQNKEILALGLSVFKHFGMKKNSPVKLIATMKDAPLINSSLELNSVLGFLEKYAAKLSDDNLTLCFDGVITDYSPEIRVYTTNKHAYLAVLEDGQGIDGRYIYAFELDESNKLSFAEQKSLENSN